MNLWPTIQTFFCQNTSMTTSMLPRWYGWGSWALSQNVVSSWFYRFVDTHWVKQIRNSLQKNSTYLRKNLCATTRNHVWYLSCSDTYQSDIYLILTISMEQDWAVLKFFLKTRPNGAEGWYLSIPQGEKTIYKIFKKKTNTKKEQ